MQRRFRRELLQKQDLRMNRILLIILAAYLAVINIIGFILMGTDKKKARLGEWRIPEKAFFIVSLLGGSLGSWLGMYVFHHKTKHWYFAVFMPLIFFAHLALLVFLLKRTP